MEDASCSGSTPFKRLVDHQSRDSSHHQDRHVSRGAFGQNVSIPFSLSLPSSTAITKTTS